MRPLFPAALLALLAAASPARGDITHIVQRGHTLEAIAHRYHVTVKAIVEANHITDPRSLKPGQSLIIPGVDPPSKKADKREASDKAGGRASASLDTGIELRGSDTGDVVHAVRQGEELHVRIRDGHGHIPPAALAGFERIMRQGTVTHSVDPRLVALIGIVSHHFGGKPIEVVSGYRAYSPTQYTPHSNHNSGKALDFRVRGVSNEALRDFCRSLRSAGCGYYPNSTFVHLDARETKAYWVDWSRPGEPPRYEGPGSPADADEGASDVPTDQGEPLPPLPPRDEAEAPAATPSAGTGSSDTHGALANETAVK
jgi:uncharacterized protein YcbK (DUF882 family)